MKMYSTQPSKASGSAWQSIGKMAGTVAVGAFAVVAGGATAAPVVSGASGAFNHSATVTISGSSFGSKGTAAPVVWDDASGTNILDKWNGKWPDAGTASYQTNYSTPIRGINLPHSHITKYITGAHGDSAGFNAGYNVVFWKNIPKPSALYMSWYQRADDAWVFGLGSPADNNFKTMAYSVCCSPYELPNNWYTAFGPPNPSSRTSGAGWLFTDDGSSLMNPDLNGHNVWWDDAVNPMAGAWSKVEMEIKVSSGNDGFIRLRENGVLRINYVGPTDKYAGTSRTVGIGGYARGYGNANNRRYFADAYVDTSFARVVLANNANLSSATIIEPQIPVSWNTSSIGVTVNLGKFSQGQTAYLFVVDPSGVASSTGFPITVGGTSSGGAPTAPTAPSSLRIEP